MGDAGCPTGANWGAEGFPVSLTDPYRTVPPRKCDRIWHQDLISPQPQSISKFPSGQLVRTHEDLTPHGGAEIFSHSYFCNISEIKAKRVKIPIKTHLTSLVPRQSAFAWRQVSGLLPAVGDYWITGSTEPEFAFFRVKAFPNQDQFNSVI